MAGMKVNCKGTVKASTILEVIIAMVLILIVFGIAMMISANVLRSSLSVQKLKAEAALHDALIVAEHNSENSTQSFSVDDLSIDLEIKPREGNADLLEIHLTAYDDNRVKLAELQKLIIKRDD